MRRRLNSRIGTALVAVGAYLASGPVAARGGEPAAAATAAPVVADRPLELPPVPAPARPRPAAKAAARPKAAPAPAPAEAGSDLGPAPTPYGPPGSEAAGAVPPPVPQKLPAAAEPEPGPAVGAMPPVPAPPASPEAEAPPPAVALPEPAAVPRDPEVERAQAPAPAGPARALPTAPAGGRQLPPAAERPGQAPAAPAGKEKEKASETDPAFALPPERLPLGRQSVGLSVDVVAPQFLNVNQTAALKVVVKNAGSTDALGVVVRDELPANLEFLSSQPEATKIDALLSWNLGTVAAGTERVITVSVKPTRIGAFDHAATVTMMAGSRSRTVVREPKLKVEQTVATGKVLRGQPVQFKIAVSNPGDGPARNVLVQAKLTPGLKHESGEPNDQNLFEQTIEVIAPGERVNLETLVADTVVGGEQSCQVAVKSPDVVAGSPDAVSTQAVTVVEPKLALTVGGPKDRFTDTLGTYEVTLENPGTAPARNVRTLVTLPVSGKLYAVPPGAAFDKQTRKLSWSRPHLDPGEKAVLSFQVRMGGVGLYQVAAEARAEGPLQARNTVSTDVTGMADVNFDVSEKRRVVDVDGVTTFVIKVVNSGSKEATRLLISAAVSEIVQPLETSGTDEPAKFNEADHKLVFPPIDRLGPGKSVELGIKVKALKPGTATCRVYLTHDDLTEKLDEMAAFRVTPVRR